ncbi:MAG: lytic transglycosylase domain-containing protein [Clostridia bacterium]|nr:lytic transglycosylase domain-containing protein [Clostridia bacterium]
MAADHKSPQTGRKRAAGGKNAGGAEKRAPQNDRRAGKKGAEKKGRGREEQKKSVYVTVVAAALILLAGALGYLILTQTVLPQEPKKVEDLPYREQVRAAHEEFGVEEARIYAVIQVESSFREKAESPSGARGLMQMLPSTYEEYCAETGTFCDPAALFDPAVNIRACTRYLRQLYDMTGSWRWTHVAYYAGIGSVTKWMKEGLSPEEAPNNKARTYLERIESAYDAYAMMFKAYYGKTENAA